MNPLTKAYWIGKGVGWDNVPRRIYQIWQTRSGRLERRLKASEFAADKCPTFDLASDVRYRAWQQRRDKFFRIPAQAELRSLVPDELWHKSVTRVCDDALSGKYPYFSRWQGRLGWPPDFNLDPVHHIAWPVGEHWLKNTRSGPPRDDIKLVWEASRLSLAFLFSREYVYSGEGRWSAAFWTMLEAWIEQNPVNESVAWGCGQEIAFRLMAILTAAFAMFDDGETSVDRLASLEVLCWQSAKRIAANINYAISQENNHALSEALGLHTVGLLFPEFPESPQWIDHAERVFELECRRQIYDDGSYVQHSMSYHRVMLDDMIWAIRLGEINKRPLGESIVSRVRSAVDWLAEFVDPQLGRVPNYGANDGANVLPLSCSDYLDYRPVLQAAGEVCNNEAGGIGLGPWSEKSLWLTGSLPPERATKRAVTATWKAETGGYFMMRGPNSRLMVRATNFRDRPSQCDMLHVDLWYRGLNVFRDAGSYLYYHRDPSIKQYFYSSAAHNTAHIPGFEQMTKGPNFLWFHWPKARAEFEGQNRLTCCAEYKAGCRYTHERVIDRDADNYTIRDFVGGPPRYELRWRLCPELDWAQPASHQFCGRLDETVIEVNIFGDSFKAELGSCWESLYYGERDQVPMIVIRDAVGETTTKVSLRPEAVSSSVLSL